MQIGWELAILHGLRGQGDIAAPGLACLEFGLRDWLRQGLSARLGRRLIGKEVVLEQIWHGAKDFNEIGSWRLYGKR